MPKRKTKRGADRTPLSGDFDVIICGASFAGLAVARELRETGAKVLMLDRYEIGEKQTSACGIPTEWMEVLGVEASARQEFDTLVVHTPRGTSRLKLPFNFSTFDYPEFCELLDAQNDAVFETAKVEGRQGDTIITDRGEVTAPLIVDALGWRRILDRDGGYQPPDAPLSRGLEVHPGASAEDLAIWIDRRYVPAGYGWSFPAGDEVRIGVGSFDPRFHVREPTELLADDLGEQSTGYQGNWIPHKIREGTDGEVFYCGDSAGHCIPLTAEGIRTALYFGIAAGREIRAVIEGSKSREQALEDYGKFSAEHEWKFRWMLRAQRLLPRLGPRAQRAVIRFCATKPMIRFSFRHYLHIAPPDFGRAPEAGDDSNDSAEESSGALRPGGIPAH